MMISNFNLMLSNIIITLITKIMHWIDMFMNNIMSLYKT